MKKTILITTLLIISACASPPKTVNSAPHLANHVSPLLIGSKLPSSIVRNMDGDQVDIVDIVKSKSVFIFYRGGWCPYCNKHLQGLRNIETEIKKLGYDIYAISPDTPKNLRETSQKNKLGYQLISDSDAHLISNFGLAFEVNLATRTLYKTFGINLEKSSGRDHHLLPVPAIFVLNSSKKVVFSHVDPDYKKRLNEKVLIAVLRELKD